MLNLEIKKTYDEIKKKIETSKGCELEIAYEQYLNGDKKYMEFIARYYNGEMTEKDKDEIIELCDFSLLKTGDKYRLEDGQRANLGGIEEERFDTVDEAIDRLETYISDIFYYNN